MYNYIVKDLDNQYLKQKNIKLNSLNSVVKILFAVNSKAIKRPFVSVSDPTNKNQVFETINNDGKKYISKNKTANNRFTPFNFTINDILIEIERPDKGLIIVGGFADAHAVALAFPSRPVLCAHNDQSIKNLAYHLRDQHNYPSNKILCILDNDRAGHNVLNALACCGFSTTRTNTCKDSAEFYQGHLEDANSKLHAELSNNINKIAVLPINYLKKHGKQEDYIRQKEITDQAIKLYIKLCIKCLCSPEEAKTRVYKKYFGKINLLDLENLDKWINEQHEPFKKRTKHLLKLTGFSPKETINVVYREGIDQQQFNTILEASSTFDIYSNMKMGSGKTSIIAKSLIDDADRSGRTVVSISHLVSLTRNLSKVLNIDYYKEGITINNNMMSICLKTAANSETSNIRVKDFLSKISYAPDLLILDEFTQIIEFINGDLGSSYMLDFLEKLIRNARRVYVADANLSDYYFNLVSELRPPENQQILYTTKKEGFEDLFNKTIVVHENSDIAKITSFIVTKNEPVLVTTDTKAAAKNLNKLIDKYCKETRQNLKICLLTGDEASKKHYMDFMTSPNEESVKYDLVIASPSLQSGISITTEHFKHVLAISSMHIPSGSLIQQIGRVRPATTINLFFLKNKDYEIKNKEELNELSINYASYSDQVDNMGLGDFDEFRSQQKENNTIIMHYFLEFFYTQAKQNGFKVKYAEETKNDSLLEKLYEMNKGETAEEKAKIKEELINKIHTAKLINDDWYRLQNKENILSDEDDIKYLKIKCCNSFSYNADDLTVDIITAWNLGQNTSKIINNMLVTLCLVFKTTKTFWRNVFDLPRSRQIVKVFFDLFDLKEIFDNGITEDYAINVIEKMISNKDLAGTLRWLNFINGDQHKKLMNRRKSRTTTKLINKDFKYPKRFIKGILEKYGFIFCEYFLKVDGKTERKYIIDQEKYKIIESISKNISEQNPNLIKFEELKQDEVYNPEHNVIFDHEFYYVYLPCYDVGFSRSGQSELFKQAVLKYSQGDLIYLVNLLKVFLLESEEQFYSYFNLVDNKTAGIFEMSREYKANKSIELNKHQRDKVKNIMERRENQRLEDRKQQQDALNRIYLKN